MEAKKTSTIGERMQSCGTGTFFKLSPAQKKQIEELNKKKKLKKHESSRSTK